MKSWQHKSLFAVRHFRFRFGIGIGIGFLLLPAFGLSSQAVPSAEVVSVYPTGSVKQVRQVTVRFATDMVPMGDPRSQKDPLALSCNAKNGKVEIPKNSTRWADAKNWVLDFDSPLPSGFRCSLKLTPATKDLAGAAVTGLAEYSFSTAGPALLGVAPRYDQIEPEQFFVAATDGAIDPGSVEKFAYFEGENIPDKIGVKIVKGPERDAVIRAAIESNWQWQSYRKYSEQKKPIDSIRELDGFMVLAGTRRFVEGSRIILHWPKGIMSKSGLAVEEPQRFEFMVVRKFEASFSCERSAPERPCNPILDMSVGFTSPVARDLLKGAKLVSKSGLSWTPVELDPKAQNKEAALSRLSFKSPFPDQMEFTVVLPKGLKDELGRKLENESKYPLQVSTDEALPLVKFAAPFGLLELNAEPILPLTLRNVEKQIPANEKFIEGKSFVLGANSKPKDVIAWYRSVVEKDDSYHLRSSPLLKPGDGKAFQIPKPGGPRDFEVIGIPLKAPGYHIVEVVSPKLGQFLLGGGPMYVASGALVTNLSVHLKKGRESSVVWVTRLDNAKPVSGAEVGLYDREGNELAKGKTDATGIFRTGFVKYPCLSDAGSADEGEGEGGYGRYGSGAGSGCEVFAFAKSEGDFSFVSNSWSRGIEEYRFNLRHEYMAPQWGPIVAHTVTDRALLKVGESVNLKTFIREHTGLGFKAFSAKRLPKRVLIVHRGSQKTYTLPFEYDVATGTALNTFKVPKDATTGLYAIYLSNKAQLPEKQGDEEDPFDWTAQSTGSFMVSEYRLPLMESLVKIQGETLVRPQEIKVDLSAHYMSGGPAADLPVKIRSTITHGGFTPDVPGGSDYRFFASPVKVGVASEERESNEELNFLFNQDLRLDKNGGALATIKGLPVIKGIRSITVEMEYRDPNGEVKTATTNKLLLPAKYIVGMRSDSWIAEPGKVSTQGVIVDTDGKPKAGRKYTVEAFKSEWITHRKRLVGGFYSYDSKGKTVSLGTVCTGVSDQFGRFKCEAKKMPAGSITLQAKTEDEKGFATYSTVGLSVYSEGQMSWWMPSDSDRIDLLPEKTKYEPGETAKFVVRSPFPTSTVLITVEREGVLDSFTKEITRENPVVEVPLKGNYAPNIFVSALAIRGRVGDPKPTALVDLAKPGLKLGMAELKIGWSAHELKVDVKTDKKKYHTRDKVQVSVKLSPPSGRNLPAGAEVALIAVDESLSKLRHNWSTELLTNMMGQRGLEVATSSAQIEVIGKRHFGSKAKPAGGGGGVMNSDSRELFDPMLLWIGRLKVDANGEAKATVTLNDSLTAFRFTAVALAGMDLFGDGSTVVEASKDLILYSGFAPLVRDGDKIQNSLTIRNTTAKGMKVQLEMKSPQFAKAFDLAPVELKPNEAKTIFIPMAVPAAIATIDYEIKAKDSISGATDSMKSKIRVEQAVPARVLQATLLQLDKTSEIPVQQPKDAIPDRGGLRVKMSASLVTGLAGVKSYMEDYPYSCLEQKVSKAVVGEKKEDLAAVVTSLPSYLDGLGLLKFFPSSLCGSAQLSRYVINILDANGTEIPQETKSKVLGGMSAFLQGRYSCHAWWFEYWRNDWRDQERLLLMEVLSRHKMFDVNLIGSIQIAPNLWATETVVAWQQLLKREPTIAKRDELLKQAENILRARVNFQGSLMNLQGDVGWEAGWHLFTSRDQEAMGVFGVSIDEPSWGLDVGRMARGVTARLRRGIWDSTMANAWGLTQLRRFSAKFEKEKVAGTTSITSQVGTAAKQSMASYDWTKNPFGERKLLPWPKGSVGGQVKVGAAHAGTGKPWMHFETLSAIPLKAPWDLGYKVSRKVTPVSQATPGKWTNGDVANIELTIVAKNDQAWVVVRDPVPAGASHLGSGLEGSSAILDRAPKRSKKIDEIQEWPGEYDERLQSAFISYAAYLLRGTYRLNYRIRLNSAGEFKLPPTRVEAMYAPETFGEAPIADWSVAQ